jgi:5,10-methylenetetrahydromethanopterin reductase
VGVVRQLLAGERVPAPPARGVRLALRPIQARLPIYLAALGPRALRLAGEVGDGVLLNAYAPPAYVRWAIEEVHAAARAADRAPAEIAIACMLVVRMTDDPAALLPTLRARIARLLDEPHVGELLLDKGGFDPGILPRLRAALARGESAEALVPEAMVDAFYVLGPAAACRARIAAYRQAGVDLPLLLPPLPDFAAVAEALAGA